MIRTAAPPAWPRVPGKPAGRDADCSLGPSWLLGHARMLRKQRTVVERDRLEPRAIDVELEDIEAIVIADDVMELLRLDALRNVDVLIEQPLRVAQRFAHQLAGWPNYHRNAARAQLQRLARLGLQPTQRLEHRIVETGGRYDIE